MVTSFNRLAAGVNVLSVPGTCSRHDATTPMRKDAQDSKLSELSVVTSSDLVKNTWGVFLRTFVGRWSTRDPATTMQKSDEVGFSGRPAPLHTRGIRSYQYTQGDSTITYYSANTQHHSLNTKVHIICHGARRQSHWH